jgi:hypothetical protein
VVSGDNAFGFVVDRWNHSINVIFVGMPWQMIVSNWLKWRWRHLSKIVLGIAFIKYKREKKRMIKRERVKYFSLPFFFSVLPKINAKIFKRKLSVIHTRTILLTVG